MVEEILSAGYAVEARDGQAGLHLGSEPRYDVIVLDRGLPAIEGLDLLGRLRSRGVVIPVLVLSALGLARDRVDGLDAGAEDYLGKPFDIDELLARIRALLRRHRDRATTCSVPGGRLVISTRTVTTATARATLPLGPRVRAAGGARPPTAAGVQPGRAGRRESSLTPTTRAGRHVRALPAAQALPRRSSARFAGLGYQLGHGPVTGGRTTGGAEHGPAAHRSCGSGCRPAALLVACLLVVGAVALRLGRPQPGPADGPDLRRSGAAAPRRGGPDRGPRS